MKHTKPAIFFLLLFFMLTQALGLGLISFDISSVQTTIDEQGNTVVEIEHQAVTEEIRPPTTGGQSFLYLLVGVLFGTILVLLLVKYNKKTIWRYWFLLAVFLSMSFALRVFIPVMLSYAIAIVLACFKIYRPTVLLHNITEVLMYSGIAVLIAPIFNILWASLLLVAISIYDIIAVWKSKHMIKMAHFMSQTNFAGLMLPYNSKGHKIHGRLHPQKLSDTNGDNKVAILGGGDVAFPLIFSGVALELFVSRGLAITQAFWLAFLVSAFAGIALYLLLKLGKPQKFYPAMPFISLGCFIGLVIATLISNFL